MSAAMTSRDYLKECDDGLASNKARILKLTTRIHYAHLLVNISKVLITRLQVIISWSAIAWLEVKDLNLNKEGSLDGFYLHG